MDPMAQSRTRQPLLDLTVGRMIITCTDVGGVMVPTVEFEGVGKITPGWFEKHQNHFIREIMRAQVAQRTGVARPVPREEPLDAAI